MWTLAALLFLAAPDRDGLMEAWEASFGAGTQLTREADGGYRLVEPQFGYDGPLEIVGTHISEYQGAYLDLPVSHQGMVDFRLEVGESLAASTVYYSWLAEHQNFYYRTDEARWVDARTFTRMLTGQGRELGWFSLLSGFGSVFLLLALLLLVLLLVGRQLLRTRGLMSESEDINRAARRNLERAAELQEEQQQVQAEMLSLARRQSEILAEIRDALRREP